jgi:hypothetical protein
MSTQTQSTSPLHRLSPADRQLLNLAIAHNLNLPALTAKPDSSQNTSSAHALALTHPARADLISFAEWFAQPHISAAADFLVSALTHIDTLSQNLSFKALRAGLQDAFQSILSFAATLPHTAENAITGNRIYRESRLLASAIKRFTNPTNPPATRRPRGSPPESSPDAPCDPDAARDLHLTPSKSLTAPTSPPATPPAPQSTPQTHIPPITPSLDGLALRISRIHPSQPAPATRLIAAAGTPPAHHTTPPLVPRDPLASLKVHNPSSTATSRPHPA